MANGWDVTAHPAFRNTVRMLARLDTAISLERRILIAAALWTTYERAGRELPRELEPFPAAPAEARSACTPASPADLLRGSTSSGPTSRRWRRVSSS